MKKKSITSTVRIITAVGVPVIVVLFILLYGSIPPPTFPATTIVTIKKDMTLSETADLLASKNIIKSPFLLKAFTVAIGASREVKAGDYLFDQPQSVLRIAYRLTHGVQGLAQFKVTVPEGLATSDIARLMAKNIPGFDSQGFLALAKPFEGYLFPDTYFFYENATPIQVFEMMRNNFDLKTHDLSIPVTLSGRSFKDILTVASLVEEEATSSIDRRIIAGILWKRLAAGMPLQVDAPFFYILGKNSSQLTLSDLAMDSPYNLYKHTGLPPTPIDNPGLGSMNDALHPTKTDYLFYLSDSKGNMHYAADHEGHIANKIKYIQ